MRRPSRSSLLPSAFVAFSALTGLALGSPLHAAAAPAAPGIAVAVVFDTSGSMNQPFATKSSSSRDPKLLVARRAFALVIDRLEAFTRSPAAQPLSVGVTIFQGRDAAVAVPLAPFDAAALRRWLADSRADAATPLGTAISRAGRELLAKPATSRHLLVLTDGANTVGRTPESALAELNETAGRQQISLFTHIVALDLAPATFAALKRHGATVIGAADAAQLKEQFDFILEEKILVEAPR